MEGILGKFDERIVYKVDGSGDKVVIGEMVLEGIENLVNPPKKLANLLFMVAANNNKFPEVEIKPFVEKEVTKEEEPEDTGGEGEMEEGEEKKEASEVEAFDPFSTLPPYCGKSVFILQDFFNPDIKFSVTIDSRSSLNLECLPISVDLETCSGVFRLEHKAPFGASIQLCCDAPVVVGPAAEVFEKSGEGRFSAVETGTGKSLWAGETSILFRRAIKPQSSCIVDLELVIPETNISSSVGVYVIQENKVKRMPSKRFKISLEQGKETMIIGVTSSRKLDLPGFDWKLIVLSNVFLAPALVLAEGGEPPQEVRRTTC